MCLCVCVKCEPQKIEKLAEGDQMAKPNMASKADQADVMQVKRTKVSSFVQH